MHMDSQGWGLWCKIALVWEVKIYMNANLKVLYCFSLEDFEVHGMSVF